MSILKSNIDLSKDDKTITESLVSLLPDSNSPGGEHYKGMARNALGILLPSLRSTNNLKLGSICELFLNPESIKDLHSKMKEGNQKTAVWLLMELYAHAPGSKIDTEQFKNDFGGLAGRLRLLQCEDESV